MTEKTQSVIWREVKKLIATYDNGVGINDILENISNPPPRRTLQYWLKSWVEQSKLHRIGERRGVRYLLASDEAETTQQKIKSDSAEQHFPFSKTALLVLKEIRKPQIQRKPVGYDFKFLDGYRPNDSFYLTEEERDHLAGFSQQATEQPAGTYARQLFNRLLIDLSWNSSRLEGNTYSLLDTRRLIQFGAEAEGKASLETQMILNHKEAIEFLVDGADEISFNRYTILNLHALLSNNLLPDPKASGSLRQITVGIGHSTFHPLDVPQRIQEYFDQILQTVEAISNPFEQAFFMLVQLPYLQPFDDVNKRVSRLSANIPLIKHNLIPLAFTDLPKSIYTEAILAVYELKDITPLKEVFIWAYERSADQYRAVQQTIGEPDSFSLRYREEFRAVISEIVSQQLDKKSAYQFLIEWLAENIPTPDQPEFQTKAENELLGLHEGNFARYRIRPKEFMAWQDIWRTTER